MSEWIEEPLGQLASIEIGGTPPRDVSAYWASDSEVGLPWVSIADLGPRFVHDTKERITELGLRSSNAKPITKGTLIMSFKLTIGRAGIADCDLFSNEAIAAIVPDKRKISPKFLYYQLPSIASNAVTDVAIKGSTLNKQKLAALRLRFPKDIGEQSRIAEILSTLDETIEQTEALIAKYQQIKAGLMHDLFTRGVTPDGKLRPTRTEAPQLYKDSPLGWIPKEWEVARLSELGCSGRPHLKTGPFGSSLKIEHWVEEGHPVITIGALGEGEFIESDLLFVSDATADRLHEYQLEVGDIVFSRVADVGRSAIITNQQKSWIMSSNLMRISVDAAKMRPEFLQSQLAYDARLRAQIRATVNAGGREVANSEILNRLNFVRPQGDEQNTIIDCLRALDAKCRAEAAHLDNLKKQKHGLMHDLLTGRVRVKVA